MSNILKYRIGPDDSIWFFKSNEDTWHLLSPAGEFWEYKLDDNWSYHELPNELIYKLGWPEVTFDTVTRNWRII